MLIRFAAAKADVANGVNSSPAMNSRRLIIRSPRRGR